MFYTIFFFSLEFHKFDFGVRLLQFKYQEKTVEVATAEKAETAALAIDDATADKSRDTEDKSADDNSEPQTTVRKLDLKTDIGKYGYFVFIRL